MDKNTKKTIIIGAVLFVVILVTLGWQPIKAASQKIYYAVAPNSGLIGYWSFDECDSCTTAKDYSGNVADGTFNGTISRTTASRIKGNAIDLNGSSGYVSVPDSDNWAFGTGDFSISTWVNFDTIRAGAASSIPNIFVAQDEGGGSTNKWVFFLADSTTVYFHINAAGPSTFITGPNISPVTGQWYNIVITRSGGSSYSFYVDGELKSTASDSQGVPNANVALTIGESEGIGYLDGKEDEIRIYNRAISAGEVRHLYEQARSKTTTKSPSIGGLVGYWDFDDCDSCSTAADRSGNGNTLTTYSAAGPTAGNIRVAAGKIGNGISLNGSSQYAAVTEPPASVTNLTTGSAFAWIKTSNAGSAYRGIVIKQYAYGMYLKDNVFVIYDFSASTERTSGVSLNDGRWHFVGFTFQSGVSSGTKLYIDGRLAATVTMTVFAQTEGITIGSGDNPATIQYFSGKIDEARVYNRALSDAEVANLYSASSKSLVKSPPLSGLSGFWDFDGCDSSSCASLIDKTGNGNSGTITSVSKVAGKSGLAGSFDGASSQVDFGTSFGNFGTSDFSVSFWMNTTNTSESIIGKRPACSNASFWGVRLNSSGGLYAEVDEDGGGTNYILNTTTGAVNSGQWTHVAMVRATNTLTTYINGTLDTTGSAAGTANISNASSLLVGNGPCVGGGDSQYNGSLDGIRIYGRALSAAEVKTIYSSGK